MLTIHFYLRFKSVFGQTFFVSGNAPELGNNDAAKALPIQYLNDEFWYGSVQIDAAVTPLFTYHYILVTADGLTTAELGTQRVLNTVGIINNEVQCIDAWNYAGEYQNAFYTQPFQQTLLKRSA